MSIKTDVVLFTPTEPTVVVTMDVNTAEILKTLLSNVGGRVGGPSLSMKQLWIELDHANIKHKDDVEMLLMGSTIKLDKRK